MRLQLLKNLAPIFSKKYSMSPLQYKEKNPNSKPILSKPAVKQLNIQKYRTLFTRLRPYITVRTMQSTGNLQFKTRLKTART